MKRRYYLLCLLTLILSLLTFLGNRGSLVLAGSADHIVLKNTNFCLNSPYRANNGNVDIYTCNATDPDQDWIFEGDLVRLKGTNFHPTATFGHYRYYYTPIKTHFHCLLDTEYLNSNLFP